MTIRRARPQDHDILFDLWLRSVRATHDFVTEEHLQSFIPKVHEHLRSKQHEFWVACDGPGAILGFMGIAGGSVDSLFVDPDCFRRGAGRALNRRIGKPQLALSGGLFTCANCGHAVTSERIKKRLANGKHRDYTYYRCANNNPDSQHPRVRWREEALEQAVLEDLAAMRMPSDEIANWFRTALQATFADVTTQRLRQRQALTARRAELATMKERLLTGYLSGVIDEGTFHEKSADLCGQLNEVERALERCGDIAIAVFDWTQRATEAWRGSKMPEKRAILDAVSLNRTLSDVSLVTTKRKPFCYLAERPSVSSTRGDRI